jgi:hypothetical protein
MLFTRRGFIRVMRLRALKGEAGMSFWVYRKGRGGRRSLYLLDVWEFLAFALIGIILLLVLLALRRLGLMP